MKQETEQSQRELQRLEVLKSILDDKTYKDFIMIVSRDQNRIIRIDTAPIDNYKNNVISNRDKDTLRYVYQNIRYYLRYNGTYAPKLEEGMAIFVSKAAIINASKSGSLSSYFSIGDYSLQRDICNPFEEISRLLLCAVKTENYHDYHKELDGADHSLEKIQLETKKLKDVLTLAISAKGISSASNKYTFYDVIRSIGSDLQFSDVDSSDVISATTKSSKGLLLEQMDKIIDMYHSKLDFGRIMDHVPTKSVAETLKRKFDNTVIYAQRNIGIYQKTKKLVK